MTNPPHRPVSHIIGDVGQTHVALQFKEWGWTADIVSSDYGEDLICDIFSNNRKTSFGFRCQVKSTLSEKGQVRKLKNGEFSVSVSSSTCLSWANSYFPIVIAIYDAASKKIYWQDVSAQAREKLIGLIHKTTSFRVGKNELHQSREELERKVVGFYSKLLSIESPVFTCNIFPVLMPFFRSINSLDLLRHVSDIKFNQTLLTVEHFPYEQMPSWITSIKSLNGEYIAGWRVKSDVDTLVEFFNEISTILSNIEYPTKATEWLSFIVSPVDLCEKISEDNPMLQFWNKKLTDWSCYNLIDGACNLDDEHAFLLPSSYRNQIARHSRSWDGYFNIDTEFDLAVQVIAGTITTPVFREAIGYQRQQIIGKFKPWQCKTHETDLLFEKLSSVSLTFKAVECESIPATEGDIIGIITVPMFEPELGLIPQTDIWDEFECGVVDFRLNESGLNEVIPGEDGPQEIIKFILSFFEGVSEPAPDFVTVLAPDHIAGMPINHEEREIIFQRMLHKIEGKDRELLGLSYALKYNLSNYFEKEVKKWMFILSQLTIMGIN
ncbi:hypothetical protein CKQ84_02935 [Shewanella sp. WE21]|uniref:DUF4365 domain-containing protein n=1 Tax=Shewanella sp. WE21 TaxID=2029986 RepID=UPI000CF74202|nr:DUF4365 domain-containing protein [Shewanella sp. WE21]AVI64921.1 hypothetical protein CKQ84_02935 [Shewanella sp. WE21]